MGKRGRTRKESYKITLKYYTKFHEEAEKDPRLDDKARETFAKLENGEPEEVELWKRFRELSLEEFSRGFIRCLTSSLIHMQVRVFYF